MNTVAGRKSLLRALTLAAAFLVAAPAAAADKVILWRVTRPGVAPSHLVAPLGNGSTAIPPRVEALMATPTTLILETELDPAALLAAIPLALEEGAPQQRVSIDPLLRRRVLSILHRQGHASPNLSRMKPWAMALAVGAPTPATPTLETHLLDNAVTQKRTVFYLEPLTTAAAELDRLAAPEQERMVRAALARGDNAPIVLTELTRAMTAADVARVRQIASTLRTRARPWRMPGHPRQLAAELSERLSAGNGLFVGNPQDLTSESAFLKELRARGWTVTREP